MYIATDATGKDFTWDSEPLHRFLRLDQSKNVQPTDLVGTWERLLPEADGAPDVSYETFWRAD